MKNLLLSLTFVSIFAHVQAQDQNSTKNLTSEAKTLLMLEAQLQKASSAEGWQGERFISDVKSELAGLNFEEDNGPKRAKFEKILKKFDAIDSETAKMIAYIDQLKFALISAGGENKSSIITLEQKGIFPAKLNLQQLLKPEAKIALKDSVLLFKKIATYCDSMVSICANYSLSSRSYSLQDLVPFFYSQKENDFQTFINSNLEVETYNFNEDKQVLSDMYRMLFNAATKVKLGTTTLLTNLSVLTSIQQDILLSRTLAIMHFKSKIVTGQYNFDALTAVVDGPQSVMLGETPTFTIFMAAKNSMQQPEITIDSNENAQIKYNGDGTYSLTTKFSKKGPITLSGTISIKNKSGYVKVEKWSKTIVVL